MLLAGASLLEGLEVVDVALCISLAGGFLALRAVSTPRVSNVADAFKLLDLALRERFPDLPSGFTWKEGISKAKERYPTFDWSAIEESLSEYKAYRYGGSALAARDPRDVLRVATALGKGAKLVR